MDSFKKMIQDNWKEVQAAPGIPITIATLLKFDQALGSNYQARMESVAGIDRCPGRGGLGCIERHETFA